MLLPVSEMKTPAVGDRMTRTPPPCPMTLPTHQLTLRSLSPAPTARRTVLALRAPQVGIGSLVFLSRRVTGYLLGGPAVIDVAGARSDDPDHVCAYEVRGT